MSRIPIHNLYYLLSYAWDLFSEHDTAPVSIDDTRRASDLLGLMLAGGIESLGRRGLFQDYQPRSEETARLRGRIDFSASLRRLTQHNARMAVHFDELGTDNVVNAILRATLDRLLTAHQLDAQVKQRLRDAAPVLAGVSPVQLRDGVFQRARVSRHHRIYRLMLAVCELLHRLAQPDEDGTTHRFRDPWSESSMPAVFEAFVRNFITRHLPEARVRRADFRWDARGWTDEAHALLPMMKTDVTIEWGAGRCLILDCKFYQHSFTHSFDKLKLKSDNLYQIAAYLHHHPLRRAGASMHGVLLYPAIEADFLYRYDFMGHQLTVASVDLNRPWQSIHERLLDVLKKATEQSGPILTPPRPGIAALGSCGADGSQ